MGVVSSTRSAGLFAKVQTPGNGIAFGLSAVTPLEGSPRYDGGVHAGGRGQASVAEGVEKGLLEGVAEGKGLVKGLGEDGGFVVVDFDGGSDDGFDAHLQQGFDHAFGGAAVEDDELEVGDLAEELAEVLDVVLAVFEVDV